MPVRSSCPPSSRNDGFTWNTTYKINLRPGIRRDYSDAPNILYQSRNDLLTGVDLIIRW